jgi:predicted ATPase
MYRTVGQPAAGLAAVAEALALGERSGEQFYMAELHRLRGVLLLQAGAWDLGSGNSPPPLVVWSSQVREAEDCFHQALAIARQQQVKAFELRAATSLSRVWQHQGKATAARQMLGEVYHRFTEGMEMPDLQEAKAVLETLG